MDLARNLCAADIVSTQTAELTGGFAACPDAGPSSPSSSCSWSVAARRLLLRCPCSSDCGAGLTNAGRCGAVAVGGVTVNGTGGRVHAHRPGRPRPDRPGHRRRSRLGRPHRQRRPRRGRPGRAGGRSDDRCRDRRLAGRRDGRQCRLRGSLRYRRGGGAHRGRRYGARRGGRHRRRSRRRTDGRRLEPVGVPQDRRGRPDRPPDRRDSRVPDGPCRPGRAHGRGRRCGLGLGLRRPDPGSPDQRARAKVGRRYRNGRRDPACLRRRPGLGSAP